MGLSLASFPQVIIKQTTAPTAAAGTLWWDTDDLLLYYYTGANWIKISSSSDAAGYEQAVAQLALEILRLSAEGTLTAPDYDSMFLDYFADVDGQDGTIDTALTTSKFSTDSYINLLQTLEEHGETFDTFDSGITLKTGNRVTVGGTGCKVLSLYKTTTCTATKGYVLDASKSVLATGDFAGNVCTFASAYTLAASTDYYFAVDKAGGAYNTHQDQTVTFPNASTYMDWTHGFYDTTDYTTRVYSVMSALVEGLAPEPTIIQTIAQALSFEPVYILLHCKDITTAGTGAVTYDVSFDSGSTWDSTGNALDAKINVTDASSKSMEIKFHLAGTGGGNTAAIKDYEVILWSV